MYTPTLDLVEAKLDETLPAGDGTYLAPTAGATRELARYNPISSAAKMLSKLRRALRGVWYQGVKVGTEADNSVRLEAVKLTLKLHGYLRDNESAPAVAMQFNIGALSPDKLAAVADRLDKLTQRMAASPMSRASAIPSFMALDLTPTAPHIEEGAAAPVEEGTSASPPAPSATPDPVRAAPPPPAAGVPR